MTSFRTLFIAIAFVSAACSSDPAPSGTDAAVSNDTGTTADATSSNDASSTADATSGTSIGAAGGTATSAAGSSVTVPAGALASDVTITADENASAALPAHTVAVGTAVTFGPEGQTFTSAATVTLVINPSLIPSGKSASDIVIQAAPAGTTTYTALTTTVVDATHVSAPTSHFSTFAPVINISSGSGCTSTGECSPGMQCIDGSCVAI